MKYSIIIPVYNSEKTIKRCIESITSQNRDDVEIVVVNDGSKDNCDSICKELQTKYNNIVYMYTENGGVSSARNIALSVVKGKYVFFVDSDDYVSEDCFAVLDKYTKSDADFYQFGALLLKDGQVKGKRVYSKCSTASSKEKEEFIRDGVTTRSINSVLSILYKREIIEANGLRFSKDMSVGEDLIFCFSFLLSAEKIERSAEWVYFVDISNENSLSRRYRANLPEQLICVYEKMYKSLQNSHIRSKSINDALSWLHYRNAYSVANDLSRSSLDYYERTKKLKAMCTLFNSQNIAPSGFKCKIISIPVKLRLVGLMDAFFRVINKLR